MFWACTWTWGVGKQRGVSKNGHKLKLKAKVLSLYPNITGEHMPSLVYGVTRKYIILSACVGIGKPKKNNGNAIITLDILFGQL